jgi:hypothetical protein
MSGNAPIWVPLWFLRCTGIADHLWTAAEMVAHRQSDEENRVALRLFLGYLANPLPTMIGY